MPKPDPHPSPWISRVVHTAGLTGLVILLVGTGFSKAAQNAGMAFALLAFLGGIWVHRQQWWPCLKADWTMRWTAAWVLYVVVLAIMMAQVHPEVAERHYEYAWKLSRFFLIGLVAWWVAIAFRRPLNGYFLLLAGFVLGALLFHHQQGWPFGLAGARVDLWEGRQFYTLFSASVLASALILTRDIWGPRSSQWFWFRGAIWATTILVGANSLLVSQSRGGLLGLAVGLVFAGAALGYRQLRSDAARSRSSHRQWLAAAIVAVLLAPILWLGWEANSDRISHDVTVIAEAIESGEIQRSSMGVRLGQWMHGLELLGERPWFGWGPGAGEQLEELAALPETFQAGGTHFHSTPLDLLLWTGIIGALIVLLLLGSIVKGLWPLVMQEGTDSRIALSGLTVMVIALTASLTQTYITSQVSWFFLAAFLGPAYALSLRAARNCAWRNNEHETHRPATRARGW